MFDQRGKVSAKTCGSCHEREAAEFKTSGHALAMGPLEKDPRFLAESRAGKAACTACHAIGERDPDGSLGRCDACHLAHDFRLDQSREPRTCARCHSGPDHPQWESWSVSKHGVAFAATRDPQKAPTCAGCHMPQGAHGSDVALSIGTVLAGRRTTGDAAHPAPPFPQPEIAAEAAGAARNAEITRCNACHSSRFAADALAAADDVKREADGLVAEAARAILAARKAEGLPAPELGPRQVPTDAPSPERRFFEMWRFHGPSAWKGAYHQSPEHVFTEGLLKLREDRRAILDETGARRATAPTAPSTPTPTAERDPR
jgi:hypothetical protein